MRKVVVGFSGGVTSAWCAGWALRNFPREEVGNAFNAGVKVRFPVIEENVTKQDCVDWCLSMGVKPSAMYCWSDHANCVGCVKGGKAYWIKVAENEPEVFAQRVALEKEFGHHIVRGGDREHFFLEELVKIGLKREVNPREPIDIGACECGD